jgi:glyoxylase-like metal-dependent hydrolase (beta-lactamase superfamily II)
LASGAEQLAAPDGTREILPGILEFLDRSPSTHGGRGFLVTGPKYNLMVDTPAFTPRVLNAVRKAGGVRYLFLSQRDEIGEIAELHRAVGGAVIMHRSEAEQVPCGVDLVFDTDFEVEPGVTVIHTPGHSPGSSCLLVQRDDLCVLFTGNVPLLMASGRDGPWQCRPAPRSRRWLWLWPATIREARTPEKPETGHPRRGPNM